LLIYRKQSLALHSGNYEPIDPVPADCFAYIRQFGDEKIITTFNLGETTARFDFHRFGNTEIIVSTNMDRSGMVDARSIDLSPWEGLVLRII
jgi:hypothetical protein